MAWRCGPTPIYLIPPKKDMVVANRRLLLTDKDPGNSSPAHRPFFRSLANDLGDRAIAVVLSGTGSDGSRGVRDVHEAGGLVIVQTPETAKFDGMPNAPARPAAVDLVLPPEEMPAALLKYSSNPRLPAGSGWRSDASAGDRASTPIFRMLRDAFRLDFSQYKSTTVSRRIERRLLLNRCYELDDYVETAERRFKGTGCPVPGSADWRHPLLP